MAAPVWLAAAGVFVALFVYIKQPGLAAVIKKRFLPIYTLLDNKYYADDFNDKVFAAGARRLGRNLWKGGDVAVIDGVMVNGTAKAIGFIAGILRQIQTGYMYHYAFVMIIGFLVLLNVFVFL